ncbi:MAG: DUF4389 domain-containing protein [Deltaproteobacteria bacterium]|nr:DUF4389 domain-containing protein [Deltaproteobacteria bacterium]
MNDQPQEVAARSQMAIRLLLTILFLPIYGLCNALVVLTTLFQFILLFITRKHSEPVRIFANHVVSYAYRIWRYVSLNSNPKPFPFAEFPEDIEPPEAGVRFD